MRAFFPPDDGSLGYERGSAVSKSWHEATTTAAIESATEVTDRLRLLAKSKEDAPDYGEKLKEFCRTRDLVPLCGADVFKADRLKDYVRVVERLLNRRALDVHRENSAKAA